MWIIFTLIAAVLLLAAFAAELYAQRGGAQLASLLRFMSLAAVLSAIWAVL